jgi:hypothetical protein
MQICLPFSNHVFQIWGNLTMLCANVAMHLHIGPKRGLSLYGPFLNYVPTNVTEIGIPLKWGIMLF